MQGMVGVSQEDFHLCATAQVQSMHPPSRNCHVRPFCAAQNNGIIGWPYGFQCFSQPRWIRFSPRKDVRRPKATKTECSRPSFAAFNSRIVLLLSRLGRVEHDEHHFGRGRIPDTRQAVAISLARRIFRDGLRVALLEPFCDETVSQG